MGFARNVLRGVRSALIPVLYGWFTFLLVLLAVGGLVRLTSGFKGLVVVIGRFIISGIIVLVWLYSWWRITLEYRRRSIRVPQTGNDEHGG